MHFGVRNDAVIFHDYFEKYYTNVFFPYLREHGIQSIVDLGDTFDRRKYINFNTLSRAKKYFYDPIVEGQFNLVSLVGNHTIYYKNTLEINTLDLVLGEYSEYNLIINRPQEISFVDDSGTATKVLMVPWICDDNYKETMEAIQNTNAQICFGHLELGGFEMYRGHVHQDGLSASVFSKFDVVASGHFHHKSSKGNINYLGCPYEMDWSDYDDPKGFHVFDTETRELTFVQNPYKMFNKIWYTDAGKQLEDLLAEDFDQYAASYIKVIVQCKNNPYWFDLWMERLNKVSPHNVQVVDDHLNLQLESDDSIIDEAEDTLTILHKYIENLEIEADKVQLEKLLRSLYEESLSLA